MILMISDSQTNFLTINVPVTTFIETEIPLKGRKQDEVP
jgi:hypothetical protein